MRVLSLFDGISCGRLALERAGVPVSEYYASEIEQHSIDITKRQRPDTKHIGDVSKVFHRNALAGGFSYSPQVALEMQTRSAVVDPNEGVLLDGQFDLLIGGSPCQSFSAIGNGSGFEGKSGLFWHYVRLLEEVKPRFFFLENVVMKKEWEGVITATLGVKPILINSALVSAQRRKRLYWTNIQNITQPEDRGVVLRDIIQPASEVDSQFYLSAKADAYMSRVSVGFAGSKPRYESYRNPLDGKSMTVTANQGLGVPYGVVQELNRRLTPVECERLQTIPDNWTEGHSPRKRIQAVGNAWTVDVIAHMFRGLTTV